MKDCPVCMGIGKLEYLSGGEVVEDECYSCRGSGFDESDAWE